MNCGRLSNKRSQKRRSNKCYKRRSSNKSYKRRSSNKSHLRQQIKEQIRIENERNKIIKDSLKISIDIINIILSYKN